MSKRISSISLVAASLAACGLISFGATAQAAPVALTGPGVQAGPVVGVPAVHKIHGRIVAFTAPADVAAGDIGPTITVEMRRRQPAPAITAVPPGSAAVSGPSGWVVEKKTFPIAAGAPIELVTNGATHPLTPAALQPGRRAALLVSNGMVNEIDLFARRAPTVSYTTGSNYYSYYTPYRFFSANWFGGSRHHFVGWNYYRPWNHFVRTDHVHTFANTSHRGVAGHRVSFSHVKTGKTFVGHKVAHHGRSVRRVSSVHGVHSHTGHHAHAGHHVHAAGHHHAGHHAHAASHAHRGGHHGGHRGGGHHKK